MNKIILMGRLTADPDLRYSQKVADFAIVRFTLAVDRKYAKKEDTSQPTVDFIRCVALGKQGEFVSKYFTKGQKALVEGSLQIGSFTNKDGDKVATADVVVESIEFAESKANKGTGTTKADDKDSLMDGFMSIQGDTEEDLPFN